MILTMNKVKNLRTIKKKKVYFLLTMLDREDKLARFVYFFSRSSFLHPRGHKHSTHHLPTSLVWLTHSALHSHFCHTQDDAMVTQFNFMNQLSLSVIHASDQLQRERRRLYLYTLTPFILLFFMLLLILIFALLFYFIVFFISS